MNFDQFATFFASYEKHSREEGNVVLRVHVGLEDGRAYCFNMAPSAEHLRRGHATRVLPGEDWLAIVVVE